MVDSYKDVLKDLLINKDRFLVPEKFMTDDDCQINVNKYNYCGSNLLLGSIHSVLILLIKSVEKNVSLLLNNISVLWIVSNKS